MNLSTYTLRNGSRIPKLWLEIHNPTTMPGGLPGRAITLGGRTERSWLIRAPLSRRGHFRIEPLHIRTGDPFGFFEASATVGQGISVVVYPRIEPLPRWRLPAAALPQALEGVRRRAWLVDVSAQDRGAGRLRRAGVDERLLRQGADCRFDGVARLVGLGLELLVKQR